MKKHGISCTLIVTILGAFSLFGCASISISSQYDPQVDFSVYKTFSWIPKPEDRKPATDLAPELRQRLRDALGAALGAKGLSKVDSSSADIHVVYYYYLGTKPRYWVSNWGYSYHPWRATPWGYVYDPWRNEWGPTQVVVDTIEVGTLIIDIIDTKSNELVWRSRGRGETGTSTADTRLMEMAKRILEGFPASK